MFFTSCGCRTGWDSFSVFHQLHESICRVGCIVAWALQQVVLLNSTCWWYEWAGIGAVWFVTRCWNISCRMNLAKRRQAERSSDALLGFELDESGTCWRPSPWKFWRGALALRELASVRCRRTGTQIHRALGHAMSLFGLRRDLYSVFQYAC